MDQIIETIQISKYNTTGTESKQNLIDKKYTLDDPTFENYGRIQVPCGDANSFFELKDVNFVYLFSTCPFNLLINNLVIINTRQFSFINPNKTITVSISNDNDYNLEIEYCYGLLKCGDQDAAIKTVSSSMGVKWDRVLKNVVIESTNEEGDLPSVVNDSDFNKRKKFVNFDVPSNITKQEKTKPKCSCSDISNRKSAVQKVQKVENITKTNDGRIRYITVTGKPGL